MPIITTGPVRGPRRREGLRGYHPITRPMFSQSSMGALARRKRRALGQSVFDEDPISGYAAGPQGPSVSWSDISQYLWPTAGGSLAQGTAQIQSVPANAAAANAAAIAAGLPAPYNTAAIQAAANQAVQQFAQENQQLWSTDPDPNDPTTWPWYYWLAIGGVGLLIVADVMKK